MRSRGASSRHAVGWRWRSLGLPALAALAVVGCAGEPAVEEDPVVDAGEVEESLHGDFFDEPRDFIGDSIEVAGEVAEVLSPMAFRLDGVGPGGTVLVVTVPGTDVPEDEVVEVTGEVQELDVLGLEEEVDADLDDDLFDPLEGEPMILAKSIDT